MSFTYIKELPTSEEIKDRFPVSKELAEIKEKRDSEINDIIAGRDNRFLMIVGPCSADNEDSVCEYINRLAKVAERVKEKV